MSLHVKTKVSILALFQKSVLNSISQDEGKVALRWAEYQKFLVKVDAIKGFKEEEYQDGFFKDVFENCLGYTLKTTNPSNFNLEREKKNETDGKKADGVIYVDGNIIGVVELKDQKTKQLDAIEAQAFNYHNSHSNSKYVIISNFDELRFYIDKKTAYESFNLFSLSYDEFKKLHLLVSFESIKDNIPQKLKDKSSTFEQSISKELYKDFTLFRTHLFENIIANNPTIDKSLLLRLTQKLCDRVIFILFAEDRGLLRHNTIKEIREEFTNQRFTDYKLYDIYKFYFEGINQGNTKLNIPKYNGGLFATDELLDSLTIDDVCLNENAQKLSNYDFVSDISVNILGHIFEQSLSDLEELNASLNDLAFDKKNSKRKKDGVFYTPEYITRYIVENTLGKLCEERKKALHVKNVEAPKNSKKPTKEEAQTKENLELYKNWLLHVKILDPACGSGAFLNQALEYLIKEHKELQEKLAIMGDITAYYEIEASILENNLYGVDINEDAVEIARLSLWLRTAQQGRALANLSGKIKCGNSLIDDKTVASNAFVWQEEFPEVFANGGFDVVIGNPPYGAELFGKEWLKNKFKKTAFGNIDSYKFFVQRSIELLKDYCLLGFILPDSYLEKEYFSDMRNMIVENFKEIFNIKLGNDIFDDVNLPTSIMLLNHKGNNADKFHFLDISTMPLDSKEISLYHGNFIIEIPDFGNTLIAKKSIINNINCKFLYEIYDQVMGVKVYQQGKGKPKQTSFEKDNNMFVSSTSKFQNNNYKYISQGIERYYYEDRNEYIKYGEWLAEPRQPKYFDLEKIIIREIINPRVYATYILEPAIIKNIAAVIINKDQNFSLKYLLSLMNSTLFTFYINEQSPKSSNNTYPSFNSKLIKNIPIKDIPRLEQEPFIEKANLMLELNRQLQSSKQAFLTELNLEKIPQKLQNFEELEFEEFVTEYTKAKKLKFTDKLEERTFKQQWQSLFENDKTLTCKLKTQIQTTDKEIDAMVYELYGLNEDEIKIVEGKNNHVG